MVRSFDADFVFLDEHLHLIPEGSKAVQEALRAGSVDVELLHFIIILQTLDRLVDDWKGTAQLLAHAENHRIEGDLGDSGNGHKDFLNSCLQTLL